MIKQNTYYLFENNKKLHHSASIEKLINFTTETTNALIYYNNVLIWMQNASSKEA